MKKLLYLESNIVTKMVNLTAFIFVVLYLYQGIFGLFDPYIYRSLYLLFTMVLIFSLKSSDKEQVYIAKISVLDIILIICAIGSILYFIFRYDYFCARAGLSLSSLTIFMGIIAIIAAIEACRRKFGLVLPIIAIFFVLYDFFGPYFPGILRHSGFDLSAVIGILYASTDGMFGKMTYIFAYYVFPFLIFGTFLRKAGVTKFFINLGQAIFGHTSGGVAKASVIGSGLLGSIMGTPTGNVAITGSVTIPSMKENKYPSHFAAAVEASASLGGSILPPIMGAAAFVMSSLTGIPYKEVIARATIPAILYFYHVFFTIHLYAQRAGLKPLKKEEVPSLEETLKEGWYYFTPIFVIIYLIAAGWSLARVATAGIITAIICAQIRKETRMSFRDLYDTIVQAAKDSLIIGAVACAIGIIVTSIDLPGLGITFSSAMLDLSKGITLLLVALCLCVSYILGMGLPITAAYLVLIVLAGPALKAVGIPLFIAHMLVLWYSQDSTITPPVCPNVFTAMSIAGLPGSKLWKTGLYAVHLSHGLYYIPIFFIYHPGLLLMDSVGDIVLATISAIGFATAFIVGIEGYFLTHLHFTERIVFLGAAGCLFFPTYNVKIIGGILILLGIIVEIIRKKAIAKKQSTVYVK